MRLKYFILFTLCLAARQVVISQDIKDSTVAIFDTIVYENEKQQIDNFILKFFQCRDSVVMQDYIYWPFFKASDPKDPLGYYAHLKDTIIGINGNPYSDKTRFCGWIIKNYIQNHTLGIAFNQAFNRDYLINGDNKKMNNITTIEYFYGEICGIIKVNNTYKISYLTFIYN